MGEIDYILKKIVDETVSAILPTLIAKEMAKVTAQRRAEKACSDAYSKNIQALDPNDPDYDTKSTQISLTYSNCLKRARGA